jgi:CMP/dCMP kinase
MTFIIAIDGPAGAGKGTLARALADRLDFRHIDTGLLYRALAYLWLDKGGKPTDHLSLLSAETLENPVLRQESVGNAASIIAAMPDVRSGLLFWQQHTALEGAKGVVMEGRDIGSVVFPGAPVKFYLTASPEIRAERRMRELETRGQTTHYEQILSDILKRDERDQTRTNAPLVVPPDSYQIDSSHKSTDQVLTECLNHVISRLPLNK